MANPFRMPRLPKQLGCGDCLAMTCSIGPSPSICARPKTPTRWLTTFSCCPYLTHINAADTPLTDASLAIWCRMPGLTSLDLQGTRITAAGIQPLRRMPYLKQLLLARTAVAEEPE